MHRKVGPHHFAFWRGHLEGLDLTFLGDRYLETGGDLVAAKQTLRWLRNEFISAARRQRKMSDARVLRIPMERLSESSGTQIESMSLEDFRAQRDPTGFYTENELIELFEQEHQFAANKNINGQRKAERNLRLLKRLREATSWLEDTLSNPPSLDDPLIAWIDESIAARLAQAGVKTLRDLRLIIAKKGATWYKKVPRLGDKGAKALEHWLAQQPLPAIELPANAFQVIKNPDENLLLGGQAVPTRDTYQMASYLPGLDNALNAKNDYEAIGAWLDSLGPKKHTIRSYRKEAERFMFWCITEAGKPMSAASVEDCIAYRDFLGTLNQLPPTESERWIGPRNALRGSPEWRPFSGALSLSSQRQAIVILKIFFSFLQEYRYILINPWGRVSPILNQTPQVRKDHSLTRDQWLLVIKSIHDEDVHDEPWLRIRFAFYLAYYGGFRLDEMVRAVVANSVEVLGEPNPGLKPAEDGDGWDLEVIGKGMKLRRVPLANATMDALIDYMEIRGHGRIPDGWPSGAPLIATLPYGRQYIAGSRQPLSHSAMFRMLKKQFAKAASLAPTERDMNHLLSASTHWLRHTHATHSINSGADITDVQENLGHASPATTAIYSHASRKRRKAAIEGMGE